MAGRAILRRDGARLVRGDLLPGGQKIRGMNFSSTAKTRAVAVLTYPRETWTEVWDIFEIEYYTLYAHEIKLQGFNTVRIQGSIWGIYSGRFTREQYYAKWQILHDMLQKEGLWLYPCGCDGGVNDRFDQIPTATVVSELTAWAAFMDTLPGVIALDLVQEAVFASTTPAVTLYKQAKAVTKKLLTYSSNTGTPAPGIKTDRLDFLDYHNYDAQAANFFQNYWTTDTRPILVGEFGAPNDRGITGQSGYYGGALKIHRSIGALGQRCAGSLPWSIRDTDPTAPDNQWGMYDLNGNIKWWIAKSMSRFNTTNEAAAAIQPITVPAVANTLVRDFDPQAAPSTYHGQPITTLPDQSENAANLTQSSSINRPLFHENVTPNGKPGLRFYGSTISLTNTTGETTPYNGLTIFHAVSQLSYAASYSHILAAAPAGGSGSSTAGLATTISTNNTADFSQVGVTYDGTTKPVSIGAKSFKSWVVLAYVIPTDGSAVTVYANGTLVGTLAGTTNPKSLNIVSLGRGITSGAASGTTSDMHLARTLIYDGVMTTDDRNLITDFLRTTYGI